jgi:hypothetical protein
VSENLLDQLSKGLIISFDQTLGNTGLAVIDNRDTFKILYTTVFQREDPLLGFDATIRRGIALGKELKTWFLSSDYSSRAQAVVHEMPAVRGYRTDSSLIAALLINQVVDELGLDSPVYSVSNTHAKKVFGLKAKATKAEVRNSVEEVLGFTSKEDKPSVWNQHVIDATMIGITHLYDMGKKNV